MYRRQSRLESTSSVINNIKKFKKVSSGAGKIGQKPKSSALKTNAGIKKEKEKKSCDKAQTNKIHFHEDVPEEVQNFIKRISCQEPREHQDQDSDSNLLNIQDERLSRRMSLPISEPDDDIYPGSRKSSIPVIVTSDYAPNNLSNNDYDRLKQVESKNYLTSLSKNLFHWKDTRFTEYEIVQLWTTFKKEFPNGRINRQQLHDLIKMIFPRGVPDLFIENIFRIFDPRYNGYIRFTDLLIAFSMSMKGSGNQDNLS